MSEETPASLANAPVANAPVANAANSTGAHPNSELATPKLPRLHIALGVSDLVASVKFYGLLFGMDAPSKLKSDYAKLEPAGLAVVLSLVPAAQPVVAPAPNHFGVRLSSGEAVRRAGKRLEQEGMTVRWETDTNCCYARQDKAWVSDPDGHAWEVYAVLGDTDELAPERGGCCGDDAAEPGAGAGASAGEGEGSEATTASGACCG